MERLAMTCHVLYNKELLEIKRELSIYKKTFDLPKIKVDVRWKQRCWNAQQMLTDNNNLNDMIYQTERVLQYLYEENYLKNERFFKQKLDELRNGLEIVQKINESWDEDNRSDVYEYIWYYLSRLFENINWMYCCCCEDLVKTLNGLCNKCDILESPNSLSDREMWDNQDMLADVNDH